MKRLIIALLIASSMPLFAAQIHIARYAGMEMIQDIALIGKWVFVEEELQLLDRDGNILASEAISNIRKICFSPTLTDVEDTEDVSLITVYPNPTHDILKISGIEEQVLRVYDMQGRMVHSEHGTQVTVGGLPVGTYILQIGTQAMRFIKD